MMHGTSLQRPNLLLPQAKMVLGCLPTLPWCARAWNFSVWVEGLKLDSEKVRKNMFKRGNGAPAPVVAGPAPVGVGILGVAASRHCPSACRRWPGLMVFLL